LDLDKAVWLELSIDSAKYYAEGRLPAGHQSQGCFPFGAACAKRVKGNYRQQIRENRRG